MASNEVRQALSFRIALATLDARQSAQDSARQLAWLADAVVVVVLELAHARSGTRAWPRARRAFRRARLRQPRRRGTGLRLRSRPRIPVRRAAGCAVRWRACAGCLALVRAARAESGRVAWHRHGRGAPVRHRRAPAAGWREGLAGVEPRQLRRLPARACVDVGTPGAGARARRGGRSVADRRLRERARRRRWRVRAIRRPCATK